MDNTVFLTEASSIDMPDFYRLLSENFIKEEIRDAGSAMRMLEDGKFKLIRIGDDDKRYGYLGYYPLKDSFFIEYLVIDDKYKGQGIGGEALLLFAKEHSPLVLEAEPPETDIKKRRIAFYRRHGFCVNDREYYQPSYGEGLSPVRLLLLSSPTKLEDTDATVREIYSTVYSINQ